MSPTSAGGVITLRAITGISKAANAVISSATATFAVNDSVYLNGITGMTQLNGVTATVTAVNAGVSFSINVDSTAFTTWSSGGGACLSNAALRKGTDGVRGSGGGSGVGLFGDGGKGGDGWVLIEVF